MSHEKNTIHDCGAVGELHEKFVTDAAITGGE